MGTKGVSKCTREAREYRYCNQGQNSVFKVREPCHRENRFDRNSRSLRDPTEQRPVLVSLSLRVEGTKEKEDGDEGRYKGVTESRTLLARGLVRDPWNRAQRSLLFVQATPTPMREEEEESLCLPRGQSGNGLLSRCSSFHYTRVESLHPSALYVYPRHRSIRID